MSIIKFNYTYFYIKMKFIIIMLDLNSQILDNALFVHLFDNLVQVQPNSFRLLIGNTVQ